jgi:DNA-binding transcriptional ArsR family regulator
VPVKGRVASFPPMPRHNRTGIELLTDPTRRRLIALIAVRPRHPSAIARELGVHRSTATRQLRLLEQTGPVVARPTVRDGRGVLYILDPRRVGHVLAWLAGTEVGRPFGTSPSAADSG